MKKYSLLILIVFSASMILGCASYRKNINETYFTKQTPNHLKAKESSGFVLLTSESNKSYGLQSSGFVLICRKDGKKDPIRLAGFHDKKNTKFAYVFNLEQGNYTITSVQFGQSDVGTFTGYASIEQKFPLVIEAGKAKYIGHLKFSAGNTALKLQTESSLEADRELFFKALPSIKKYEIADVLKK